MPVPTKSALAAKAKSLLQQNGIEGEKMSDLADVLGEAIALAMTQLLAMAKVAPGISVPGGSSATPGSLV